ncbi:hypothetical protein [Deinococcus sp.]|nr:hypothetical protein [Deinococcus sp.]
MTKVINCLGRAVSLEYFSQKRRYRRRLLEQNGTQDGAWPLLACTII